MDFSQATDTRSYRLPIQFWGGLLQVRDYLLQDPRFFNEVFCYPLTDLGEAFFWVDHEFKEVWMDDELRGLIVR